MCWRKCGQVLPQKTLMFRNSIVTITSVDHKHLWRVIMPIRALAALFAAIGHFSSSDNAWLGGRGITSPRIRLPAVRQPTLTRHPGHLFCTRIQQSGADDGDVGNAVQQPDIVSWLYAETNAQWYIGIVPDSVDILFDTLHSVRRLASNPLLANTVDHAVCCGCNLLHTFVAGIRSQQPHRRCRRLRHRFQQRCCLEWQVWNYDAVQSPRCCSTPVVRHRTEAADWDSSDRARARTNCGVDWHNPAYWCSTTTALKLAHVKGKARRNTRFSGRLSCLAWWH